MAHTGVVVSSERNHIALLLVQKYPFLKGSFGAGHVSYIIMMKSTVSIYGFPLI
jgi:hypothetical protein